MEVVSRAVDLVQAMRQKNQVELNSDIVAKGEAQSVAVRETEASAAKASLERPAWSDGNNQGSAAAELPRGDPLSRCIRC